LKRALPISTRALKDFKEGFLTRAHPLFFLNNTRKDQGKTCKEAESEQAGIMSGFHTVSTSMKHPKLQAAL
jgi:hypothetical protein